MQFRSLRTVLPLLALLAGLSACSTSPPTPTDSAPTPVVGQPPQPDPGSEVTIFALGLLDTGYRFGGKNPDAGLDCSGMVSYIYERAAGMRLRGSAADIARQGRSIEAAKLRPGDLVFYGGRHKTHVGIYAGNGNSARRGDETIAIGDLPAHALE